MKNKLLVILFAALLSACSCAHADEEVRTLGVEDLNFSTGGTGAAETTQSAGGVTTTDIDATHIKLRRSGAVKSLEDSVTGSAEITGGTIDNATVGATTPTTGKFTTVEATNGAVTAGAGITVTSGDVVIADDQNFKMGTDGDYYCKYVSASGQLVCYSASTGGSMTDTNAMVTFHVAVGGTLDTGQRIFAVKDDSGTYFYVAKESAEFIVDVTAPSYATDCTDGNCWFNASNTTDPGGVTEGTCHYNTTSNTFKCYNGATWDTIGP